MKRIKINKNKSIGSVIYIVEGKVTEQNLIKNIFNQLLDYELYQINGQEKLLNVMHIVILKYMTIMAIYV